MTLPAHDRPQADGDDSRVAPRGPRRTGRLGLSFPHALRITERGPAASRLVLELFAVLCLTVCYYFLVRNFAVGVGTDCTNQWVFTACAKSTYHLDTLYDWWKGRLSGLLLSGSLFDLVVKDDGYQIEHYAVLFGLYQAFWLLVLLLTIVVAVRQSLLVNLGIFAGLIYNCVPGGGLYFYPWDLPATVFLTLAVLLHERGHRVLMLAAICAGCLFKETVLVGAILCLFSREWKSHWRLLSFAGLAAFYVLGERYLISTLHVKVAVLPMGDAANVWQLLRPDFWIGNLQKFFSEITPQVLFANAGTLVAVLVIGWKKRSRPYTWVIVAFVAGHYLRCASLGVWQGAFREVRIFTQVLPLSCLVLSEYARRWAGPSADAAGLPRSGSNPDSTGETGESRGGVAERNSAPERTEEAWACRKSDTGLILIAVVMILSSSSVVIGDYYSLMQIGQRQHRVRMVEALRTRAEGCEATAQYALGNRYYEGNGVATNRPEAFFWFKEAAERGHTGAQLALGLCYLRGEGTTQSHEASISCFQKVVAQGNQEPRGYLGLGVIGVLGLKRDTTDHFQYLAWLGPLAVAAGGLSTIVGFVRKRKTVFNPTLCVAVVLAVGAAGWWRRYGGIETLWQNTVARDSNRYSAHCHLGNALLQSGRLDEAITHFQEVVELQPDNADAHNNWGKALAMKGRLNEATAHFRKAVELQPDGTDGYDNLGFALAKNGQLDEAVVHFRKAVELQPENANAHNNLGFTLALKGQRDEAIRQYREALKLKPDFVEANDNLARALGAKKASTNQPTPPTKP